MSEALNVYLDGRFTGRYERTTGGRVGFAYDAAYSARPGATPLSMSLPFGARLPPRAVDAYFSGLIPEGADALEQIRRQHALRSTDDAFSVLRHIGRDAPGAVQILPESEEADVDARAQGDVTEPLVRGVPRPHVRPRIRHRHHDRGLAGEVVAAGRAAEDGAAPARIRRLGDPRDSTPTTHILKPAIPGFAHHDVNEFLTMRAAAALGLDTARTDVLDLGDGLSVLVSHRYDRLEVDGRWRRLHQEDLCQALSVMPGRKYQDQGGPGIAQAADLFSEFEYPGEAASARARFFDAVVFNVAAWATDAHAKNFSVMLRGNGQQLAPLYDLATYAPYGGGPQAERSAMKVGDEYRLSAIGRRHLQKAARRLQVDADLADARIDRIRDGITAAYDAASSELTHLPTLAAAARTIVDAVHAKAVERGWGTATTRIDLGGSGDGST
ncbi:HipA domain-containing protein [Clavibacter tessellarius]|uniref:HipA domain-containing protein n=1 Tax=Clavibacter tessellarius TaxID=31965 RepID=UPI0032535625